VARAFLRVPLSLSLGRRDGWPAIALAHSHTHTLSPLSNNMSPTSPWAALVLLSVLALAGAQTAYHVANFAQMQTAISSATSVDVILVSGTITGSVTLPANSVTLNIVADPAAASQPTWTATSNTPLVSDVVGWSGSLYISGIALAQSSSNSVPTPLFDFSHSLSGGSVVLSQVLVSMSLCRYADVHTPRTTRG